MPPLNFLVDQYPVIEVQKAVKSWFHLGRGTARFACRVPFRERFYGTARFHRSRNRFAMSPLHRLGHGAPFSPWLGRGPALHTP